MRLQATAAHWQLVALPLLRFPGFVSLGALLELRTDVFLLFVPPPPPTATNQWLRFHCPAPAFSLSLFFQGVDISEQIVRVQMEVLPVYGLHDLSSIKLIQ